MCASKQPSTRCAAPEARHHRLPVVWEPASGSRGVNGHHAGAIDGFADVSCPFAHFSLRRFIERRRQAGSDGEHLRIDVANRGPAVSTRIFLGFGEGTAAPTHLGLLSDSYPSAAPGRALAWNLAANPLGLALGAVIRNAMIAAVGWRATDRRRLRHLAGTGYSEDANQTITEFLASIVHVEPS